MKPKDLAESTEALIISTLDEFSDQVEAYQTSIYNKLTTALKDLKTDPEGYILQNVENRKVLNDAEDVVDSLLPGSRLTRIVSESIGVIPDIDDFNIEYFGNFDGFKENRIFIKQLQTQAIESLEQTLLQDGLAAQVKLPIKQILNQNINTGGQFSGLLKQLRVFIEGDTDLDGRLLSYSRGILRDGLFQYSRSYQQSVTEDLGLEWYLYSGGLIDTSRPFCVERAGKFFHQKEIESWASLDWAGKNPLTTESSIFVLVAGFNCSHSLIPVDTSIVPKKDLDRIK